MNIYFTSILIASAMHLMTFNSSNFKRYDGIEVRVMTPKEIVVALGTLLKIDAQMNGKDSALNLR
jgi:hypothetical protein